MTQQFNKKLHSFKDFYRFMEEGLRTFKYMRTAKKEGDLEADFVERIMLAVTEVNGCQICTYFHTSEALKNGVSETDIANMLGGSSEDVPKDQAVGVFFAQHYADSDGHPTEAAWNRLLATYGRKKAMGVLGATRAIMIGNTHGIAVGALKGRLKGQVTGKTSLWYELGMTLAVLPYIPAAILTGGIKTIQNKPLLTF